MAEEVGEENFFLFGLTADPRSSAKRSGWYSPQWHYNHEPETRARALDLIFRQPLRPPLSLASSPPAPRRSSTLESHYMHLASSPPTSPPTKNSLDFYADPDAWTRRATFSTSPPPATSPATALSPNTLRKFGRLNPCPVQLTAGLSVIPAFPHNPPCPIHATSFCRMGGRPRTPTRPPLFPFFPFLPSPPPFYNLTYFSTNPL